LVKEQRLEIWEQARPTNSPLTAEEYKRIWKSKIIKKLLL
jgi:hypothetical protein